MGDMADMYDYLLDDDEDYRVTCNRCGKRDLHWEETRNGWRLYHESGRRHDCLNRPAKASEFEVLDAPAK